MGTSDVHVALDRVTGKLAELGIAYAICGGMAVNAHGHQRATVDVDLLLTADGLARFKQQALGLGWLEKFPGSREVKDAERKVPIDILLTGDLPGDGTPHGIEFPDPTQVTVEKDGKRHLDLGTLLELKLASGLSAPDRLQDHADVVALIRCNRLGAQFGDGLHPYVRTKYGELWQLAQRTSALPE